MSAASPPPWETDERELYRQRFGESLGAYDREASDYVANLSTQSGFRQIGPDAGARLLPRIERRIEAAGGSVTVHHLAVLTIARRRL